jgi:hypothetical protein
LSNARGKFIVPFDVDLIPIGNTIYKHLKIAELSPQLLITGYRVMTDTSSVDINNLPNIIENTLIAPEDKPTALWKHLLKDEKFGIVPFFIRERLIEIHAWDETFIAWGGEDQDIIERYLEDNIYLCRSPQLVYLHLHHEENELWNEPELTEKNRLYYCNKLQKRLSRKNFKYQT